MFISSSIMAYLFNIPDNPDHHFVSQMLRNRSKLYPEYEKEWLAHRAGLKQEFLKNKSAIICDDFRDQIREWFVEW